jgi:tRNA G46 methylase TrmB
MLISYDRQTINSSNPIARFAHRARIRKSLTLAKKLAPAGATIVDFGAGTGTFLSSLGDERPDVSLFAVEPYMPRARDGRIN